MTEARADAGTVAFSEEGTITKTATGRSALCAVNLSICAIVAQNSFFNIQEVLIMANASKIYAYGRVATADQLHPEVKQQLGTICLLQKMGYTVVLAPNHFAGDERDLTILPILADLEAEHPEFQNVVKLLQTDSILVIKGFGGK